MLSIKGKDVINHENTIVVGLVAALSIVVTWISRAIITSSMEGFLSKSTRRTSGGKKSFDDAQAVTTSVWKRILPIKGMCDEELVRYMMGVLSYSAYIEAGHLSSRLPRKITASHIADFIERVKFRSHAILSLDSYYHDSELFGRVENGPLNIGRCMDISSSVVPYLISRSTKTKVPSNSTDKQVIFKLNYKDFYRILYLNLKILELFYLNHYSYENFKENLRK